MLLNYNMDAGIRYYMRPSLIAETDREHIDRRLADKLTTDGFEMRSELFTPEHFSMFVKDGTFCRFEKSFPHFTKGDGLNSFILVSEMNDLISAILIATYVSGQGYYINYLCRNNAIKESKGHGGILFQKFLEAVSRIAKRGHEIKVFLVDVSGFDYYNAYDFVGDEEGYTSRMVSNPETAPNIRLKRQNTYENIIISVNFQNEQMILDINPKKYTTQMHRLNECLKSDYDRKEVNNFEESARCILDEPVLRLLIMKALNAKLQENIPDSQKHEIHKLRAAYIAERDRVKEEEDAKGTTKRRRKPTKKVQRKKTLAKRRLRRKSV